MAPERAPARVAVDAVADQRAAEAVALGGRAAVEERAVEEEHVARRRGSDSQSSAIRSQRCTWIVRRASRSYTTRQWPFENRCSRSS
jgi:hypothetical protein